MKSIGLIEWGYTIMAVILGVFAYIVVDTGNLELGVGLFSTAAAYSAIAITTHYYKKASQQSYDQAVGIARGIDNYFIEINRKIDNLDKKIEELKPKKKKS